MTAPPPPTKEFSVQRESLVGYLKELEQSQKETQTAALFLVQNDI